MPSPACKICVDKWGGDEEGRVGEEERVKVEGERKEKEETAVDKIGVETITFGAITQGKEGGQKGREEREGGRGKGNRHRGRERGERKRGREREGREGGRGGRDK